MCHACFRALAQPVQNREGFNPCLPRYCATCKVGEATEAARQLDAKLAGLRIKLADIAKEHPVRDERERGRVGSGSVLLAAACAEGLHACLLECVLCDVHTHTSPMPPLCPPLRQRQTKQVEPELLHLLVLLDVKRSAEQAGEGAGAAPPTPGGDASLAAPPTLRCGVADADAVASPWDRRADSWRKAVTAALRPLHKELQALQAAGSLPNYKACRLEQLQSDAAMLICNLQGVGAEGASQDAGVGLFPAAAALNHSCRPNCLPVTMGES